MHFALQYRNSAFWPQKELGLIWATSMCGVWAFCLHNYRHSRHSRHRDPSIVHVTSLLQQVQGHCRDTPWDFYFIFKFTWLVFINICFIYFISDKLTIVIKYERFQFVGGSSQGQWHIAGKAQNHRESGQVYSCHWSNLLIIHVCLFVYLYLYITWQYALLCYRATGVT